MQLCVHPLQKQLCTATIIRILPQHCPHFVAKSHPEVQDVTGTDTWPIQPQLDQRPEEVLQRSLGQGVEVV
jgi:hypothetical protein